MNLGTRTEQYILFLLSFIAAVYFFVAYPAQDPRSAIDMSLEKKEIELKATEKITDLGFAASNYTISDISFLGNQQLIDSLQYKLGRKQTIALLKNGKRANIKPYFWVVAFDKKGAPSGDRSAETPSAFDSRTKLRLYFDQQGAFIGFKNPLEYTPQQQVQRKALASVFYTDTDSTIQRPVFTAVSDSLVSRLLYFDMQKQHGKYSEYQRKSAAQTRSNLNRGIPYQHSVNDARAMADYYLSQTGWDISEFQVDSTYIKRINTANAANIRYRSGDSSLVQPLEINVVVSPTGALLQMSSNYTSPGQNNSQKPAISDIVITIIMFGLVLAGLIIFFFRMRARSIDTQSALVVAVIMGLVSMAYIYLGRAVDGLPFGESGTIEQTLFLFLQMGISGAFASVGFFMLFAVSDSLTRQHWPQKIASYDYLQQGMIFNKPVGFTILRAIGLAFALAGIWTLILSAFPHVYFSFSHLFISEQAAWPPLYLLLANSWVSFGSILAIFLVIGSLAYGHSSSKWLTGLAITLASGILVPFYNSFGPPLMEFLLGVLLGAGLLFIYLKWDLLTLLLSHFLFLGLMGSVSGWVIPNSPDLVMFIVFLVFLAALAGIGCLAIYMGQGERSLPQYVPDYVEELAQEQRIKQELEIAREVQQSFLPSRIPAIKGLDVAAICKPAYETGGDYYDFIPLDDHRVAVAIGDVSGKGIQAAFYMTFVKGMLHSLCRETNSPARVLSKANRLFYDNAAKGTFVSLIYGIIDLKKQSFTLARAGHNPIIHAKASSGKIDHLQPRGLGLGLTNGKIFDNKIREIELSITEDDLFLLYTDGITEALNERHQFYGVENLVKLIKKKKRQPASKIVSAISKKVTRFIGTAKQHDDMTLLAIRFGKKDL